MLHERTEPQTVRAAAACHRAASSEHPKRTRGPDDGDAGKDVEDQVSRRLQSEVVEDGEPIARGVHDAQIILGSRRGGIQRAIGHERKVVKV